MPVLSEIDVRFSPNGMLWPSWKSAADVTRGYFESEALRGKPLRLDDTAGFQIAKDARDEIERKELWKYRLGAARIEEGDVALIYWK